MTEIGRVREKSETDGFTKVLVDAKTLSIAAMRVGTPDRRPSQSIAATQPHVSAQS
jgi:hypothetical protein